MKILKVYVDTSVIGGCFDAEFQIWSNRLFEDFHQGKFKPIISEVVAEEINSAPEFVKEKYIELIELEATIISVNEECLDLISKYQERKILDPKYRNDMLHISLATVTEVDILTSWNFKHIVHFEKIRAFNAVNWENGYKKLEIYSPREVATNEGN